MSQLDYFKDVLIHDVSCFSAGVIKRKAANLGFTQPWVLEAFAWDLELYGQLQSIVDKELILKGGAAAQFFVPIERQRASIDIDVIALIDRKALEKLLKAISKKFGGDSIYFRFKPYTPKEPKVDLPMYTYEVFVPSSIGHVWKTKTSEIKGYALKIDVLRLSEAPVDCISLSNVSTFALDLAFSPFCATSGSLIGDKLLTLATESIGIPESRGADLPKQFYDLDNLLRFSLDEKCPEEAIKAISKLIPVEAEFRNMKIDVKDVFAHIANTLKKFSLVDTSKGNITVKKYISDFQNIYIRHKMRAPLHKWASQSLRLNFFLECLKRKMEDQPINIFQLVKRAIEVESSIQFQDVESLKRRKLREKVKNTLLNLLEKQTGFKQKELRGKPPERVYWQLIQPGNMKDIEEELGFS